MAQKNSVRWTVIMGLCLLFCLAALVGRPVLTRTLGFLSQYQFSIDWFSHNIPNWEKHLAQYEGRPGLRYLEIGVFEGRSFIWMLENILTHETSQATAIDIFPNDLLAIFTRNIEASGCRDRVEVHKERSQVVLRTFPLESFDIIYIDGAHDAQNVLTDAVLSWQILKAGGVIIFDDYDWGVNQPVHMRPRMAIDAFMETHQNEIEILQKDYQVFLKKRPSAD